MDNEPSVPSLMPVGSDTRTHNVVRGSPSIDLRAPKFCGRYISSERLYYVWPNFGKTTHNVKHGSSVRDKTIVYPMYSDHKKYKHFTR